MNPSSEDRHRPISSSSSPDGTDVSRRNFCKTGLLAAGAALAPTVLDAAPAPATGSSVSDLAYLPAVEQLRRFRTRELSPVDVLQAQIERIETLNPLVNCITYKHYDQAMQAARDSEARYARGTPLPLDGLTVAVKDEHDRVGWVTTQGSLLNANHPPATENAAIIDMLLDAGAVLHIQTTVPEFYLGAFTWTRLWGITRNPWNRRYSPGGSSGGSGVALAAGFTTLATGSDMGGSIRVPASQCGLYGFKPPFGRVPTSEIAYETNGPLARTFQDMRLMQQFISGPHPKVHSSLRPKLDYPETFADVRGWRVAVDVAAGISELDTSITGAGATAIGVLQQLGCTVELVDLGFSYNDFSTYSRGLLAASPSSGVSEDGDALDKLSRYVVLLLEKFLFGTGPPQAGTADDLIKTYHQSVQTKVFLAGFQALVMPTVTSPHVPADYQIDESKDFFLTNGKPMTENRYLVTWPWNSLSRYPVVNVPIGRAASGVPVGMQIITNTFDDLAAFRLAAAYSGAATPFFAGANFPDFRDSV